MGETINNLEQFNQHLRKLTPKEDCQFMIGLVAITPLCGDERFECIYRGEDTYSLRYGQKKECKRPKIMELKKMLGVK
jgi:hypothetical protein